MTSPIAGPSRTRWVLTGLSSAALLGLGAVMLALVPGLWTSEDGLRRVAVVWLAFGLLFLAGAVLVPVRAYRRLVHLDGTVLRQRGGRSWDLAACTVAVERRWSGADILSVTSGDGREVEVPVSGPDVAERLAVAVAAGGGRGADVAVSELRRIAVSAAAPGRPAPG